MIKKITNSSLTLKEGLTNQKFSDMLACNALTKIQKYPKILKETLEKLNMPIKYFGTVDTVEGLVELMRDSYDDKDLEYLSLYKAVEYSKEVAQNKHYSQYLSRYNLENYVEKRQIIRGEIKRNEEKKIIDSRIAKQDVKFWTVVVNSFEDMLEAKIAKKLEKEGEFVVNINDNIGGVTQAENKAKAIMYTINQLIEDLPVDKKKEFVESVLNS